jgi:hypothetical protein
MEDSGSSDLGSNPRGTIRKSCFKVVKGTFAHF